MQLSSVYYLRKLFTQSIRFSQFIYSYDFSSKILTFSEISIESRVYDWIKGAVGISNKVGKEFETIIPIRQLKMKNISKLIIRLTCIYAKIQISYFRRYLIS